MTQTNSNLNFRYLLLVIALVVITNICSAQRNTQYTQFMPNKLWINPGYAGSYNLGVVTAIAREQWIGLNGSPSSQGLNFHTPMANNRIGVGLNISFDEIGPTNNMFISGQYSYRLPLKKGTLGIGLNASINNFSINFNQLEGIQAIDQNIPGATRSRLQPNFGFGAYYQSEKFFGGLSVPFLLRNELTFVDDDQTLTYAQQDVSMYAMAGMLMRLSDKIALKPSVMVKYDRNSPLDMDLNASLIFFDRLWTGLSYRVGTGATYTSESIDFIVQYQFTNALRMGLAYDYTLTNIQTVQDGSFEILLQYAFEIKYKKKDKISESITNPRFF